MAKLHEIVFYIALYLSYFLYIIAYLKIEYYNPKYLEMLHVYMKYYVSIFLIIRFNPFTNSHFTEFDRKIVFSSAIFLLTTTAFNEYAKQLDLNEFLKFVKMKS